jgi:hypothetical protein
MTTLPPYEIVMHLTSKHISEKKYNEVNPGIGLRYQGVIAGIYKNSFYRNSAYVGIEKSLDLGKYVAVGFDAGFVTGYAIRVAPFVSPNIRVIVGKNSLIVNFIPGFKFGHIKSVGSFGFSVGRKF